MTVIASFGKNDDMLTLFHGAHQRLDGHGVAWIKGQKIEKRKGEARPPFLGNLCVDGKAWIARPERSKDRPVQKRHVIGDNHRLVASLGNILLALDLDAVKQLNIWRPRPLTTSCGNSLQI